MMTNDEHDNTLVPNINLQRPVFRLDGNTIDDVLAQVHYLAENRGRLLGYVMHLARFAKAQEKYIDELERKLNERAKTD